MAEEFGVSVTTVQNWRNLVKPVITDNQYWEAFLATRYKGKAGFTAECDPVAFDLYKSYYLTPAQRSFQSCYHWVLQRAARFFYLQRTAFGGKPTKANFGVSVDRSVRFDISRIAPMLEDLHERLSGVVIECLPYADVIKRYGRPV
ncbi:MAG: hypothetical protein GQ535_16895 [Rhodobacteraceae bacterium]|nr:hypothetical protein [Paracoccaceae bacterium]